MIISNAKIVLENNIVNGYIEFNEHQIIAIKSGKTKKPSYNAKGLYLLPAFIDSHTHGGYGFDANMLVNKPTDQIKQYLHNINHEGVSSVLLTSVTCSDRDLENIAKNYSFLKSLDLLNVFKG
jgi:N-acetylglucosamine-6-phosphate deacetylase